MSVCSPITNSPVQSYDLLGCRIQPLTSKELTDLLAAQIESQSSCVIANHNLHSLYLYQRDPVLRKFFADAEFVHIDGMGIVVLGKTLGLPLLRSHRVTYVDWVPCSFTNSATVGSIFAEVAMASCGPRGLTISRTAAVQCACSRATRRRIRKSSAAMDHSGGVCASDGPGPATKTIENAARDFWMYKARGVPEGPDDGTLAPGAVAASLPFAPELVADTLRELVRGYPNLRSEYGLRASLNPTFGDWVSPLNYGLDQGPIVMMVENHRTGLVWNLMRRCPYIWRGTRARIQLGPNVVDCNLLRDYWSSGHEKEP